MKKVFLASALALASLASAPLALAHAILVTSTPTAHGTVHGPAITVTLKFNSRVDRSRSRLMLLLPNGATQTLTLGAQSAPEELDAHADLGPGVYTLRWQAVAADGHISRGEIPFKVQ